jgi:TPP-dependent pyruvate/acetoin dehydrogenase alpha subunit
LHGDGQGVGSSPKAAGQALAYARSGHGPVFLVCETERLTGHYIGDAQVYRDKEELQKLRETRDPIQNLRERLAVSQEEWTQLDAEAQSVVDSSVEFAKAGTDPSPSDAVKYVYAEQ